MRNIVALCLGMLMVSACFTGCGKTPPPREVREIPEPMITHTEMEGDVLSDALLGMVIDVPSHWEREGSLIFSYREMKPGLVRRTFVMVPEERMGLYENLTNGESLTADLLEKVDVGFSHSMVPILELVLWDRETLAGEPEDMIEAPNFAVLQESERFVWLIGRWLRANDIALTEDGAAFLTRVRAEGEHVKEALVTGLPLTAEYAFSGVWELPAVSRSGEETHLTDTLVLIWAGDGAAVKDALKLWRKASWWDGPPVVTVRLPARGDEKVNDGIAGELEVLKPTAAWEDMTDLIHTVPMYVYVDADGYMKALTPYATKEGWQKSRQEGF